MTTAWQTETDERQLEPFGKEDWEKLSIAERVNKAAASGLSGKLGSKNWDELTPGEKATIEFPEERPAKQEYQVKSHVALEDSDGESWGIARDTENDYSWKTGEGQIVGTWSRSPSDSLIHVFLETPIQALVDKATQHFAEYAEARRMVEPVSKKARAPRAPKAEPEPSEELIAIDNIRKLLGK